MKPPSSRTFRSRLSTRWICARNAQLATYAAITEEHYNDSARTAELEQDVAVLTIVLCVTAAALDRPVRAGEKRMTWTEAMLRGIDSAKEGGYRIRIFDTIRAALEIDSEPPPTDWDGGSRNLELVRKAA